MDFELYKVKLKKSEEEEVGSDKERVRKSRAIYSVG